MGTALGGYEDMVKMMLQRGNTNADTVGPEYGQKPLLWAATNEDEGVIKLLSQREDLDSDTQDGDYSQTPLM